MRIVVAAVLMLGVLADPGGAAVAGAQSLNAGFQRMTVIADGDAGADPPGFDRAIYLPALQRAVVALFDDALR